MNNGKAHDAHTCCESARDDGRRLSYALILINHLIGRCCTKQLCPKSPWVYSLSFAYMQSYDGAPAFAHSLRPRRPAPRPPLMTLVAPPPRVLLPRPPGLTAPPAAATWAADLACAYIQHVVGRHSHNHGTPVVPIRRGNQARPSALRTAPPYSTPDPPLSLLGPDAHRSARLSPHNVALDEVLPGHLSEESLKVIKINAYA